MFDVTAMGEVLIDFTSAGTAENGMRLFQQNPGGAPANVACAVRRLGKKSAVIGKVGADMHGEFLRDTLNAENVETRGLRMDPGVFTTLAFVSLDSFGDRHFSFARKPGADTMLTAAELDVELIADSRIFHVGSLSLTDEPSRSATLAALDCAQKSGCLISYDPNYRAALWPSEAAAAAAMQSILPYVRLMKLSDSETALLTGFSSPERAAEVLVAGGVLVCVVTLGDKGCYVCTKEGGRLVPPYPAAACDSTGAGDCFWGAFLSQLCENPLAPNRFDLDSACRFADYANAAASLCVEKRGAIPSLPTAAAVLARMAK